jgi:hypothetical protein
MYHLNIEQTLVLLTSHKPAVSFRHSIGLEHASATSYIIYQFQNKCLLLANLLWLDYHHKYADTMILQALSLPAKVSGHYTLL